MRFWFGFALVIALQGPSFCQEETVFSRIERALGERRYDRCLELLAEAPAGPERDRLTGEVHYFRNQYDAAIPAYERYLASAEDSPDAARARFRLAEAFGRTGNFQRAVVLTQHGLDRIAAPKRQAALAARLLALGREALDPKDGKKKPNPVLALQFLDEAEPFTQRDPALAGTIAFARARAFIAKNDHLQAIKTLAPLVDVTLPAPFGPPEVDRTSIPKVDVDRRRDPPKLTDDAVKRRALRMLGESLLGMSQPGRAREVFRRALAAGAGEQEAVRCLKGIARSFGFPRPTYRHALDEGTKALERLVREFPKSPEAPWALNSLANAHRSFNRPDAARVYAMKLASDYPSSDYALAATRQVAQILRGEKAFAEALATYDVALDVFSAHPEWAALRRERIDTEYAFAVHQREVENRTDAARLFGAFLAAYPLDARVPAVLLALGEIASESGDTSVARERFTLLASKYPASAEATKALFARATLEEKAGEYDAARATLKSIRGNGGAARLGVLEREWLDLETETVASAPKVVLHSRNVESIEFRLYRISPVDYFQRHLTLERVEKLDVPLIRPDHVWTVKPAKFAKYEKLRTVVDLPETGPGAFVVSATFGTRRATTLIVRSDIRLIARMAGNRIDAIVGRGADLAPVEEARLLVAGTDRVVVDGRTGPNGLFSGEVAAHRRPKGRTSVLAVSGDSVAWARIDVPEVIPTRGANHPVLLWLDRGTYHPGDLVHMWSLGKREAIEAVVEGPSGIVFRRMRITPDASGFATAGVRLPERVTGTWTVSFRHDDAVVAKRTFQVRDPLADALVVDVKPRVRDVRLGKPVVFDVVTRDRYERPMPYTALTYTVTGDNQQRRLTSDAEGRATIAMPSDRFGLTDSVALDVYRGSRWVAGDIARIVWDGFRASVRPLRNVYLSTEDVRVAVEASTFDGTSLEKNVTVVVKDTSGGRERVVARVPVKTAAGNEPTTVVLPIEGEGAFALALEGDEGMVPTESAVYVSGPGDAKRIRILAESSTVRPGTTMNLRVHSRVERATAVVVIANHRDRRIERVVLEKGTTDIPIAIRSQDLPWLRVRVGVAAGTLFHEDEVTVAVDDPLSLSLRTVANASSTDVALELSVKDAAGKPARASGVVLLVPAELASLYRGLFQGVEETFMGNTKAPDSPLASSYPFTYRGGREVVQKVDQQIAQLGSNWSSIVDRKAVIMGSSLNPIQQDAAAFNRDFAENYALSNRQSRARTENVFSAQPFNNRAFNGQQLASGNFAAQTFTQQGVVSPQNVVNPMFLNQGSGRVSLSYNEAAQVLNGISSSAVCGTFQCVDTNSNRWREALVVNSCSGTVAMPTEDLEVRRRRLAQNLLAAGAIRGPRVFAVTTDADGRASFVVDVEPGRWQAIALVADQDGVRFGETGCPVERSEPVEARVIAPVNPIVGDRSVVDVIVKKAEGGAADVALVVGGREVGRDRVVVDASTTARARFTLPALAVGEHRGTVTVGATTLPIAFVVHPKRPAAAPSFRATRGDGADSALVGLRDRLDHAGDGPRADAARLIAMLAARGDRGDAAGDLAIEQRLAALLFAQRSSGGWSPVRASSVDDEETSILVAWALGAAEKAGFTVPKATSSKLAGFLRRRFAETHRTATKSALLLGLSRLGDVDFAFANRLYRARESLSTRDLGIVLRLLRRQGDHSPMVTTLVRLLASKQSDDGSFGGGDAIDALSSPRVVTAICAGALRAIDDAVVQRAVTYLRETAFAPAREAIGAALTASLLRRLGTDERWRYVQTEDDRQPIAVKAERVVRFAPLTKSGYPVRRGYSVEGHYRWTDDKTDVVGVGKRCRVELKMKLPYRVKSLVVTERIPAGFRLVPGSKSRSIDASGGVLRAHFVSSDVDRKGYRWHVVHYELEAVLPGTYAFQTPTVVVPGAKHYRVEGDLRGNGLTVLAEGENARKKYALTPQEYYDLGRICFLEGDDAGAYGYLSELMKRWRPRKDQRVESAAMMLDIALRRADRAAAVDHFEIVKEGSPERTIPFRKILPIVEAYRSLGEHERALQVQRGALGGFFEVDFAVGTLLKNAGDIEAFRAYAEPLFDRYPQTDAVAESRYYLGQTLLAHAGKQRKPEARERWLAAAKSVLVRAIVVDGGGASTEGAAFALAGALLQQERYAEAARLSARARELYPDTFLTDGFDYAHALSRFELGEYDAARAVCDRIANHRYRDARGNRRPSPNRSLALHMLAKIHHARGEIEEAIAAYRKVRGTIPDAARALDYFEWRRLEMPELTELAMNEDRTIRLVYKNVKDVSVRAYRVDLMTLYLRERSLNRIAKINLAGIEPFFAGSYGVRASSYRQDEVLLSIQREKSERTSASAPIPIVLPDAGAYLIVVRSGNVECMGMVLRSDLRMDVQTTQGGALRATVYDRTTGAFATRVEVKFVGSGEKSFHAAKTDLRGVAEVAGLSGAPTVIARRGDQFSFYRASGGGRVQRASKNRRARPGNLTPRLGNLQQQLDSINKDVYDNLSKRQKERGAVRIKQVK